jgi:hypothetical protein
MLWAEKMPIVLGNAAAMQSLMRASRSTFVDAKCGSDLQVELRHLGVLVTGCIRMRDLFTQDDVTSVLSQLVHRQPLPPLIMRTLINVWQVHTESRRCACLLSHAPHP